ncbi:hypothetical protein SAM23877_2780 [Streptomyces ambofaciens ATCC 23877]|uniref:Uncharacterized protein n=1 Tax=Streptomyces ambofaciens (strain ATCC 23877 / 3486 / DSM 40053 / JCM 4204 / NBRC 12836 / NRRL B-2516) TaxID=278992 RepID=A0A0K2AS54_STRA7|nr:hypothetical protein SAM23877_2780 [Streptomyces ambofaciens ATCC 23877]
MVLADCASAGSPLRSSTRCMRGHTDGSEDTRLEMSAEGDRLCHLMAVIGPPGTPSPPLTVSVGSSRHRHCFNAD